MTHFLTPTPLATLQPLVWYVVIYLSSVSACPLVTDCVELLSKGWWWWWGTVNDKRMTVGGGFIRVEEEPWRHTIMSPKQLMYSFRVTLLLLSTKQSRIYFLKVGVWNRIKMNKKNYFERTLINLRILQKHFFEIGFGCYSGKYYCFLASKERNNKSKEQFLIFVPEIDQEYPKK